MTSVTETEQASTQLNAIYSMMEEGQQSVKMESHSLLIWGVTAAVLILVTDLLFNRGTITVRWQLIFSQTAFISIILFFAGRWDLKLTRKVRQARDESLSFIQLQLTKVWWFFIALIVVLNVGMNFFGGGYMFYGLTISLIGMAFYIQGLFSTQVLKWIGAMLISIGLISVALQLHFIVTKWLAASVFGLGLPLLAFILNKKNSYSSLFKRFVFSVIWLVVVITPAMIVQNNSFSFSAEGLTTRSLSEYKHLDKTQAAQKQILHMPAGTNIPVNINMAGNIFTENQTAMTMITLTKNIDVIIENGKMDSYFRVSGQEWKNRRNGMRLRQFNVNTIAKENNEPMVKISFKLY